MLNDGIAAPFRPRAVRGFERHRDAADPGGELAVEPGGVSDGRRNENGSDPRKKRKTWTKPRYRPVFTRLARRGVFLFIHALLTGGAERISRYRLIQRHRQSAGRRRRHLQRYGGILEEFPNLKVCVAHGGGQAPYIRRAGGSGLASARIREATEPQVSGPYLCVLYYDTILHDQRALKYLSDTVGTSQKWLGSDSPYHLINMGNPEPHWHVDPPWISAEKEKELILRRMYPLIRALTTRRSATGSQSAREVLPVRTIGDREATLTATRTTSS